jgi:hypothetical protein
VEIWFGILGRKTLSGASFSSTDLKYSRSKPSLPGTMQQPFLLFGASEKSEEQLRNTGELLRFIYVDLHHTLSEVNDHEL